MEKETKIVNWEQDFFVHQRIVSSDERVDHHIKITLEGGFNAKEGRKNNFQTHNWELETTSG